MTTVWKYILNRRKNSKCNLKAKCRSTFFCDYEYSCQKIGKSYNPYVLSPPQPSPGALVSHGTFTLDEMTLRKTESKDTLAKTPHRHKSWIPWNLSFRYILFHKKRLQMMLWHHNARVNSHQRWKQTRFRVCFHLWCELTSTMNLTEWQVSWNSPTRLSCSVARGCYGNILPFHHLKLHSFSQKTN